MNDTQNTNQTDALKPELTLEPEKMMQNEFGLSNNLGKSAGLMSDFNQVAGGVAAGTAEESVLTEEEREQVETFCNQIDLSKSDQINVYGSRAQKGIASYSTAILSKVRTSSFGDAGRLLLDLNAEITKTSEPKRTGILGLFQKGKFKVKYLISNFETVEANIKRIERDLQKHQQVLTKDNYMFDEMYDLNIKYYKELTMYIIAGKKALAIAREEKLPELQRKAQISGDQIDTQEAMDYENACNRFERKISDLQQSRANAMQTSVQIRQTQQANLELVDSITRGVINSIPIWRTQMAIRLGIQHQMQAIEANNALVDATNEMLKENAEMLKLGAIESAKASERSYIDIETLKKCNADIITSINEVIKIHEEGSKKRAEVEVELVKIEEELKAALMEASVR